MAFEDGLACNYRERNANLFGYRNDVRHKLRIDVRRPARLVVSMHPHVSNMHRDVIRNVRELLVQCARCLLATSDAHYQGGGRSPVARACAHACKGTGVRIQDGLLAC